MYIIRGKEKIDMLLNRDLFEENDRAKVDFLNRHYEFCYLESMHYFNKIEKMKTIITGLSYGITGLESDIIGGNTINFSMHAQELYYDYMHIKRAIDNSDSISSCVITLGYYSLYYDLSFTKNKYKCFKTYLPLFSDMHHLESMKLYPGLEIISPKDDLGFAHQFGKRNRSFWGRAILREHSAPKISALGGWLKLSQEEREKNAFEQTQLHNKHIKYIETYKENVQILNNILALLNRHHIRTIVVILPFSKEYLKYINPLYKESIMQVLEESPYPVDFMDMNEEVIFYETDMLDSDHLNLKGAKKASLLVKGIVEGIL